MKTTLIKILDDIEKRYTEKTNFAPYTIEELDYKCALEKANNKLHSDIEHLKKALQTLKSYQDIEDELGIDLTIIGKMLLQKDIYTKEYGYVQFILTPEGIMVFPTRFMCVSLNFKDCGKTWVLAKEELEDVSHN